MAEQTSEETREKTRIGEREERILQFWQDQRIFEKSLEKDAPNGEFVFYDGPPFATGLPHYGHILAGTIKDVIPRYRTMRGYRVRRHWGWDCHGLPLENEIEQELDLSSKAEIEAYGVERFNEKAREAVLRYADSWRRLVPRMGRWVDMERDYRTMDPNYMETVWWVFAELNRQGLVYEGFKSMHLCPRCGTTLSNFEVSSGYAEITDLAVTAKFSLTDEPDTYLLAWTTTPWTLPGNMALAVHRDAVYVKIHNTNATSQTNNECYIVAKALLEQVMGDQEYEVVEEVQGSELVGTQYHPLFDYYTNAELDRKENAWQIYHSDDVSMEEGTGIVHIAPAFGPEDLALARQHEIPVVHHVREDGRFAEPVTDFAGEPVKPKGDHQRTDIAIIKHLAHNGVLFAKEKVTHSYPHCWRCDTPLLNYATSSWFVEVTRLRDQLLEQNRDIDWVPPEIGTNRFGNWLEGVRDWAVSRSRYWGAPLPVWREPESGETHVLSSVSELLERIPQSGNTYYLMRHGEATSNQEDRIDSNGRNGETPMTEQGEQEVRQTAAALRGKGITTIYASPLTRTQQTARLVAQELGLGEDAVVTDERLREIQLGELDGQPIDAYRELAPTYRDRMDTAPQGGETLRDVRRRIGECLYDIDEQRSDETILIVAHEYPLWMATALSECTVWDETLELNPPDADFMHTGTHAHLPFRRVPHNREYELDLHKPYIDEVAVRDEHGRPLERVEDVFDCWFESGAMPYAQHHYPFENTDVFAPEERRGFPADFIAEGLDQTRGWFYSLIVLGVGLFGTAPYKHVIVNGTVLAADGSKMSKRKKNYPDPMDVANTYGVDAMRYYLLSSPVVRAEDFSFDENEVGEVQRKNIGRLENVVNFFETYGEDGARNTENGQGSHVLDRWIVSRLHELIRDVTAGMEAYELDRAARPIATFIDDLSTWYLRRSRERLKAGGADGAAAAATLRHVLTDATKVIAPFMPFFAEDVWQRIGGTAAAESVHLADWPEAGDIDQELVTRMAATRQIVSDALEARSQVGMKVRQPLQQVSVNSAQFSELDAPLQELIRDEVNVKAVTFTDTLDTSVQLDTELTEALKREGAAREFERAIQDARKKAGCDPLATVSLTVSADQGARDVIEAWQAAIQEKTLTRITFGEVGDNAYSCELGEQGVIHFDIS